MRSTVSRIFSLVRTPFFLLVSFWGNACVVGGAMVFHHLEEGVNPAVHGHLDCLAWAVGMVTTVGTSNVYAVTSGGKILTILMMMGGAVFIWSYMALFVGAFVEPELKGFKRDVDLLQHDMEEGEKLLLRLRGLTEELEGHLGRKKKTGE